jgi:hypothetical protein
MTPLDVQDLYGTTVDKLFETPDPDVCTQELLTPLVDGRSGDCVMFYHSRTPVVAQKFGIVDHQDAWERTLNKRWACCGQLQDAKGCWRALVPDNPEGVVRPYRLWFDMPDVQQAIWDFLFDQFDENDDSYKATLGKCLVFFVFFLIDWGF